ATALRANVYSQRLPDDSAFADASSADPMPWRCSPTRTYSWLMDAEDAATKPTSCEERKASETRFVGKTCETKYSSCSDKGCGSVTPTPNSKDSRHSLTTGSRNEPSYSAMTGDMRLRLGGNVIAKDLVDVPVGREEVLPYLAGCALRLLIDELDASAEQSSVGNCKVVDFKGDDRTASEEIVVFVELTID